jgi:class 3 adenylate cyclase
MEKQATNQATISRTIPLPFLNGTWAGFAVADMSLQPVGTILREHWRDMFGNLEESFKYTISLNNSNIFVVNQVSPRSPEQQGLLIGTSTEGWWEESNAVLGNANESDIAIVSEASRAILKKYGSWSNEDLVQTQDPVFYTRSGIKAGKLVPCDPLESRSHDVQDCVQVATHSMSLDDEVRWLIVVVLPAEAYFRTYTQQAVLTTEEIDKVVDSTNTTMNTTSAVCIVIIVLATVVALFMAVLTNVLVLGPLARLGVLMKRLGNLDFAKNSLEHHELCGGGGRVREVNVLREGFCRLSKSIETFAKFVPETVVHNLVSADGNKRKNAAQLHVVKKNVTIMFSDVADFTTISETLPQKDLILVLTIYLTRMTQIVKAFEGVVGEVLGDGLLCFWNTPDNIEEHASKACMAALAQQQALGPINEELRRRSLPELRIRIGLHTGNVLTGNIGSEQKMKFGCMGDPVNLASRLEGLCKVYGVGILCSGATCEALSESVGFITRRLDLVQVKGKKEPTCIYEIIGVDTPQPSWKLEPVTPARVVQKQLYEHALEAYQKARFTEAVQFAERIHQQCPDDLAASKLLERAQAHEAKLHERGGFGDSLNAAGSPTSKDDLSQWTGVEKMVDK